MDNPHRMSIEEVDRRTRLNVDASRNQSTPAVCDSPGYKSRDEIQRERQESKQLTMRKDKECYSMELYSKQETTVLQDYHLYTTLVDSESKVDQNSNNLTAIEKERGGDQVPYVEPPSNGEHYRRKLEDAPKLQIQIKVDPTKCHLITPQGNSDGCYSKEEIKLHNSRDEPCVSFGLFCNDRYARTTTTDLDIVVKGIDDNSKELYEEKTKYPLKFNHDAIKNTPSERSWQDQASCSSVTKEKEILDRVLPYIKENITNLDKLMGILDEDGILDLNTSLSWHEPVGELLQYLVYQENGIEKFINALKLTGDSSNLEIAAYLCQASI